MQRVSYASVTVEGIKTAEINHGLLVLLGVGKMDDLTDIQYLLQKITQMRIFSDRNGKMNLALDDIHGHMLLVSQFTLYANTKKGNRPSYTDAEEPLLAKETYTTACDVFQSHLKERFQQGHFGEDMQINLVNEGPVTIWLDSKQR